jgi:hypothetical protein
MSLFNVVHIPCNRLTVQQSLVQYGININRLQGGMTGTVVT